MPATDLYALQRLTSKSEMITTLKRLKETNLHGWFGANNTFETGLCRA